MREEGESLDTPDTSDQRLRRQCGKRAPSKARFAVVSALWLGTWPIKVGRGLLGAIETDKPGAEQLTYDEMKVAVEEAHRAGRKVAAHAHGTEGIKDAVRAGVDSIEHGSLVDAEGIAMMKAHGTYLVADIYNDDYILGKAIEFGLPKENVEKAKADFEKAQKEEDAAAGSSGIERVGAAPAATNGDKVEAAAA